MGANAQTSVPAFTSGQVLTAAQVTQINTGIPVFASSTERDAAFGGTGEKTLAEGQMAYLEDTDVTQVYDGSTWVPAGGGTYIDYSASVTFNGFTLGNGTVTAHYVRIGDFVHYTGELVLGSTSSFTGPLSIGTLPVTPASDQQAAGNIVIQDTGTASYTGLARVSTTSVIFYAHDETGSFIRTDNVDGTTPMTWVSGDKLYWTVVYRAA